MNSLKTNSWKHFAAGVIIYLLTTPFLLSAQTDSIVQFQQSKFVGNLIEVGDLYCFSDTTFFPGKFQFTKASNFNTTFKKLNLKLFPEISGSAKLYFEFLNSLPINQKQNLIRLFSFYEKQMEKELAKRELPLELKYFAPAFSGMNPTTYNSEGKAGVWQLTHLQAVLNGLEVNKLVDERLNVNLSVAAFAQLMKQNTEVFENPEMAVLAWIYGNTKIRNARYFAGENQSLENVLKQLPETAAHCIALYQAIAVFLNENRYKPAMDLLAVKVVPDTVKISRKIHFRQISDVLHISENQLQFLNPQFKFDIVPGNEKQNTLIIPNGKWDDFVLWQDSVYNSYDSTLFQFTVQKIEYPPAPNRQYLGEPVKDLVIEGKTKIKYMLKSGDVLGIIAEKYDVRVADLMYWNNISNERRIQAGKKLDIFIDDDKLSDFADDIEILEKKKDTSVNMVKQFQQQSTLAVFEELNARPKVEYIVKSGESPFTIAQNYDGVSPEEILMWNGISDARKIQIGQKLIIYLSK